MRKMMILALAAAAVAAPAAALAHDGGHGRLGHTPIVTYEFVGTVTADATADAVQVGPVHAVNRHARRALAGTASVEVKLATTTRIRVRLTDATPGWSFGPGTSADLRQGDRVRIEIRAAKGLTATDLPAAAKVRDFTPHPASTPVPPPPTGPPIPGTVVPPGATPPTGPPAPGTVAPPGVTLPV